MSISVNVREIYDNINKVDKLEKLSNNFRDFLKNDLTYVKDIFIISNEYEKNAKKLEETAAYLMCGSAICKLVLITRSAVRKYVPNTFETMASVSMFLGSIGLLCASRIEKNTASNLRQEGYSILSNTRETFAKVANKVYGNNYDPFENITE